MKKKLIKGLAVLFLWIFWYVYLFSPLACQKVKQRAGGSVVPKFDFEHPPRGWKSLDRQAQIRHQKDPEEVKSGSGMLEYHYTIREKALPLVFRRVLRMPQAKSLRMWVKSTATMLLAVVLEERDGSRYNVVFFSPKQTWQDVAFSINDFTLAKDSRDENGKLDLDQVHIIGFLDTTCLFSQKITVHDPERSFFIDDLEVLTTAAIGRCRLSEAEGRRDLIIDTFETASVWIPVTISGHDFNLDDTASVAITTEPAQVKAGNRALQYSYNIEPKNIHAAFAFYTVPAEANSIHFWIKTNNTRMLVLILGEKDKSLYQTNFYLPANRWQEIRLNLNEFQLWKDSVDENNKLDAGQIQSIGIFDLTGLLVNISADLQGKGQLWIDDLTFSTTIETPTFGMFKKGNESVFLIDNFESELIHWYAVSVNLRPLSINFSPQVELKTTAAEAASSDEATGRPSQRSLEVNYQRPDKGVFVLGRNLDSVDLSKAAHLSLYLKSSNKGFFIMQLTEKDNSKYNTLVKIEGNYQGWQRVYVALKDFRLGRDSTDENAQLDPDQIKEISIIDATTFLKEGNQNTLWIDSVMFILH